MRLIISGGGTGGHVYPAIAIGEAVKDKYPDARLLFVGARGKMEMKKVPKAGFQITGLPIRGFQRKWSLKNIELPFRIASSLWKSYKILKEFQPQAVIGVGGYASAPVVWLAGKMGIPTLLQEQNSFPGLVNRWLASKAAKICVAFPDMDRFFPVEKVVFTGNPIRKDLFEIRRKKQESQRFFDLGLTKTLLIFGGSLGAKTLNEAVIASSELLRQSEDVQMIWQSGELYHEGCAQTDAARLPNVHLYPYLDRMDLAYAAADVVVCRAGALTISELAAVGKASVLVPSPNVTDDHQSKNADTLVNHNAAEKVRDDRMEEILPTALKLLREDDRRGELEANIRRLGRKEAATLIVNEIERIAK